MNALDQETMKQHFSHHMSNGATQAYKKQGQFEARLGQIGELIETVIDGEKETQKVVEAHEVVIRGPLGECYVVPMSKFLQRYEVDLPLNDFFQFYTTKGLIQAYCYLGHSFYFMASWGELMLCKEGDYLACPVTDVLSSECSEVYRIERKAFDDTYVLAAFAS